MAQPKVIMVPFFNPSDEELELRVSVTPGNLDQAFVFPPGQATKGPEGYTKFFKRRGLIPGTGPEKQAPKAETEAPKAKAGSKGKGKDKG